MSAPAYALVVGTIDRGEHNYLGDTLASFAAGGVFTSAIPTEVHVAEGGGPSTDYLDKALADWPLLLRMGTRGQTANRTSIEALTAGLESGAPWIISTEDDVAVCGQFIESVDAWLARHAREDRRAYTLYTPYEEVRHQRKAGREVWEYPVGKFYGTQAILLRAEDARSLIAWFWASPWAPQHQHFDYVVKEWHQATYPKVPYFWATVPSFVQHTGKVSALGNDARWHWSTSWPGPDWSYVRTHP